jgi:C-terminal processing protease CtpA/Prc
VIPGSPADRAGIVAGDTLIAIDGQSLDVLGPNGVYRLLRREGVEVVLTLHRGSRTVERKITLRRLV